MKRSKRCDIATTSGQRILTKDRIAISPGTVPRLVTVIRRYTLRTHPFNGPLSRTTRLSRYQKQPPEIFSARFARSGICTPTLYNYGGGPGLLFMVVTRPRVLFQFRATVQKTGTAELEFLRCCTCSLLCNCSISIKRSFALFALLVSMCCWHRLKWSVDTVSRRFTASKRPREALTQSVETVPGKVAFVCCIPTLQDHSCHRNP